MIGAILIGGQSTRMRGTDKAKLRLQDGRTMLEHVAAAMNAVCDEGIVLVGGSAAVPSRGWEPAESHRVEGLTLSNTASPRVTTRGWGPTMTIADLRPQAGPLGAIEALLVSNLADAYLVCPCDVPQITPDVLRLLLAHREAPATVLRMRGGEQFEPLPARISATTLPVVRRLLDSGQRSVWRLMEELPAAIVEIDERHAAALRNINTPDDLRDLNTL